MAEVKEYRRRLYESLGVEWINDEGPRAEATSDGVRESEGVGRGPGRHRLGFLSTPWRFPLWQVANRPEMFAYNSPNGMDGICLIERVDTPDGRIVIVCIDVVGNPGNSVANCAEYICDQVCDRFRVPADRLMWIQHGDRPGEGGWDMVTRKQAPPVGPFAEPEWWPMADDDWADLRMRPKARLIRSFSGYESKVKKLFDWPTEALFDPE